VILPGGAVKHIDEKYQVPDEQVLQRPQGQTCLKRFLEGNDMIYKADDALDVRRFLKDVLPGATPLVDQPEVYAAKAVHERFLAAPGLRLIPDGAVVRRTILKAVGSGKVVVRLQDGRAYDAKGRVDGEPGRRRRVDGDALTTFPLDDTVWVTCADTQVAGEWVTEDRPKPGKAGRGAQPPPPPPPEAQKQVTATTSEKAIEFAQDRPLLELRLRADKPADAAALAGIAQPLGAEQLSMTVTVAALSRTVA
jgi:hypothetical protein